MQPQHFHVTVALWNVEVPCGFLSGLHVPRSVKRDPCLTIGRTPLLQRPGPPSLYESIYIFSNIVSHSYFGDYFWVPMCYICLSYFFYYPRCDRTGGASPATIFFNCVCLIKAILLRPDQDIAAIWKWFHTQYETMVYKTGTFSVRFLQNVLTET